MTNDSQEMSSNSNSLEELEIPLDLDLPLDKIRTRLEKLRAEDRLKWAYAQFGTNFAITTSFGIQSAVLLHMLSVTQGERKIPVVWVDTGYLPTETYCYAEDLTKKLDLDLRVTQSLLSPARMEALHGKLWETGSRTDLEKYHFIRKVQPLDQLLKELNIHCWASGVRGGQTDHRRSMTLLDPMRGRLSIRPLLEWTSKDVFYYMKENDLPQHPLFEKGYATVGDWHSSAPDGEEIEGRRTRFGGIKEECGIHLPGMLGEGI